ncbi:MAG TPA: restriction endonuclease subunit S, partial [Agitococcus sp.]|nr:restriction endonuclease subunit S [Agitococcus sp.]
MTVKQGYKLTEVGVIPKDWEVYPLDSLLTSTPRYGINAPATEYLDTLPTYLRITDITEDGKFNHSKKSSVNHEFSDNYFLNDGDIVLARTGASVGKSYAYKISDGKLVFAGFLIKIAPNQSKISSIFLSYLFQTKNYWNWVTVNSMRSGQAGINGKEYATFPVTTPTLPEQTAIANALSDADAYINSLEQLIAKKQQIKQGTMQELLTGKKRLEGFSGEWVKVALYTICNFINGRAYNLSEWESEGVPVIRLQNLTGRGDNFYYSNLKLPEKQYCLKGDLLFMWSATFGIVVWQGEKAIYHYHIWKVVPITWAVEKSFLFYILDELTEKLKKSSSNGGTMLHITKEKMEATEVFIPSDIEEQTAIANILTNMDNDIQALQNKLTKAKHIKQGMMQEL